MKKGQEYTGIVEKVKFPNKGIVRITEENDPDQTSFGAETADSLVGDNAGTVIVKDVLPGQRVRVLITKKKAGRAEGRLIEVIERSPEEVAAKCPYFGTCGGCTYSNLPYDGQLKLKEEQVKELLAPLFADESELERIWEGIKPSPVQYEYRNKMEFSFGDACIGGELELGLHKKGSMYDIVSVCKCCIVDEDYRKILTETLYYFRGKGTPYYQKKDHKGYLRHLMVRKAQATGEILVDLVTTSEDPAKYSTPCTEVSLLEDYKNALLSLKLKGRIIGILNTVNDSVADAVKNDRTDILYGKDHFYEELSGLRFRITPFSFFQTNTLSAEVLYETAREYIMSTIDNEEKPVIFDLYSGTGTISQVISPVAKRVIGVEIVDEAVEAAKENAELNGLHNVEFLCGDVLKVLDTIEDRPELIILDPPRDGIHPRAIKKIMEYGARNIVYISCKPTSLARDMAILMAHGYVPERICAVDQFPNTVHVETIVLLSRV
ncbi:MAG: 23S rRNA (uracil(1939)-C(5))-methyltransferase RlmD [Lachnospiraceae bacterium]|nr:23S rRNA (uracil(1939)-C(5))-methyltransferase RlmD [Lachnospiraceae bacterium]